MSRRFARLSSIGLLLFGTSALCTDAHSDDRQHANSVSSDSRDSTARLFHTGLGIGARLARVGAPTTAIVAVSEGLLVLGDTVEAGVEVGRKSMDHRLLMIAHNKETIDKLRTNKGHLRREDPEYAAVVGSLIRDITELQGMDAGDYFTWALSSPEAKVRMIRVPVEHYATAFLGKWIARSFGVGPRIANTFRDPMHVRRDLTRAAWKKSDGFARMMGNSLEELYRRLATVDARLLGRHIGNSEETPRRESNDAPALPFEPPVLGVPRVVPLQLVAPIIPLPVLEPPPVATPPLPPVVAMPPQLPTPIAIPPLPPPIPTAPPPQPQQPAPSYDEEPSPPSRSSPFRPGDSPSLRQLDRINRTGNW